MSNSVTTINKGNNEVDQWSPDQLQLIKDTVAKNATNDELKLFLYRCRIMGLDPLKPGQIHFVKYGNSPGTIIVGIEGFRAKAAKTGKISGISRGVIRDDKGKCIGAWAEVHRSDWQHPAREEVSLAEYSTGKSAWAKMPETMIKKVAEAAALRMAFPDDLGGVYTREEMDQAEAAAPVVGNNYVRPEAPMEGDGVQRDGLWVKNGPPGIKGKLIQDIDPALLKKFLYDSVRGAFEAQVALKPWVRELLEHSEPYVEWSEEEMDQMMTWGGQV